jgi:hypothetical protein
VIFNLYKLAAVGPIICHFVYLLATLVAVLVKSYPSSASFSPLILVAYSLLEVIHLFATDASGIETSEIYQPEGNKTNFLTLSASAPNPK